VVAVNLALADFAQRLASRPLSFEAVRAAAATSPITAAGSLVVVAVVYGWIRNFQLRAELSHPVDQIVLAGIQVNSVRPDGLAPARNPAEFNIQSMEGIYEMSDQALARSPRPELVVWPENAYRGRYRAPVMRLHGNMDLVLDGWVASRRVPLIFGGVEHAGERDYNAIFALAPERERATGALALQTYRKGRLFPIGERIPGAATFPFLKRLLGVTDKDFDRPDEPPKLLVVALPGGRQLRIAPSVCFEAIYPNPILDASRLGAQVIVNLTNDGPFGRTVEPHQHLAASIFRSVETRLPMLRVAKTGISALVLPDGALAAKTSIGTCENLQVSVPIVRSRWTLMRAWGDWFGPFSSFVAGAWVLGVFLRTLVLRRVKTGRRTALIR
jgi:apolipoprotein N-acyltransferase